MVYQTFNKRHKTTARVMLCFLLKIEVYYARKYILEIFKEKQYKPSLYFLLTSACLHFTAGLIWLKYYDTIFPYFKITSATYLVRPEHILGVWKKYPKMILFGSREFGTTLFGVVGWLWGFCLLIKVANRVLKNKLADFSNIITLDRALFWSCISFFLLLNFLPHNFTLDQYYSVPRIFRYLAPLSFMLSFYVALVLSNIYWRRCKIKNIVVSLLVLVNVFFCIEATMPTKVYRKKNYEISAYLKQFSNRTVYMEAWVSSIHKQIYLKNSHHVPGVYNTHKPEDYEKWLKKKEPELKEGTLLVTGLNGYTHYAGHSVGFRFNRFKEKLGPNWKLLKTLPGFSYMPNYEDIKIWMYSNK